MIKLYSSSLLIISILLSGCAATNPGPTPQYTGFLPDYSLLREGKKGQAERIYVKPGVNFASYTKIMLDPVTVWRGSESQLNSISPADAQHMADYFYQLMYNKFSQNYQMVSHPEANTLRISVALVTLEKGRVVMETVSTVIPQVRVVVKLADLVSDDSLFVGKASVEAKVTDALTGTLLAEGVDERVGGLTLSGLSLKTWGDVENVMQFWVNRASYNLCMQRDGNDCIAPKLSIGEKL